MAELDFPADPGIGDEYPFGDFVYVYDGEKWTTKVVMTNPEEFVNKAGDTMTGDLYVHKSSGMAIAGVGRTDSGRSAYVISDDNFARLELGDGRGATAAMRWDSSIGNLEISNLVGGTAISLAENGEVYTNGNISTSISAPVNADQLTRKDYVDNLVFSEGAFDQTYDWNALEARNGVYRYGASDGVSFGLNGPIDSGYAYGIVMIFHGFTSTCQMYFPHNANVKPAFRVNFDGDPATWTPWNYITHTGSPASVGLEDRMAEFEARLAKLEGGL